MRVSVSYQETGLWVAEFDSAYLMSALERDAKEGVGDFKEVPGLTAILGGDWIMCRKEAGKNLERLLSQTGRIKRTQIPVVTAMEVPE